MDDLIEFIVEFVFDLAEEVAKDKSNPKWLRVVGMVLIGVGELAIVTVLTILGIELMDESTIGGIALLAVAAGLAVLSVAVPLYRRHKRKQQEKLHPLERQWTEKN